MPNPFEKLETHLGNRRRGDNAATALVIMCPAWSREYVNNKRGLTDREVILAKLEELPDDPLVREMRSLVQSLSL